MKEGAIKDGNVVIKHLDSPNITTYVDGRAIDIRNHQAIVDISTAKRIMEGPWGYELVGVYDNFIQYVNEIQTYNSHFASELNNDDQHVLIATPLTGSKIYSWDKYIESILNQEGRENISLAFTIDETEGEWVEELKTWASNNYHKFRRIALIFWDHDKEMAWNRVFKITVGRQLLFNYARSMNSVSNCFSHLWFVDSDMVHKADSLKRLLGHARNLCAGIYNFKAVLSGGYVIFNAKGDDVFPFNCLGEQVTKLPEGAKTIEADWTGAGSLLLEKKVFMNLDFDWGKWIQRHGEDAWICLLAQKHYKEKVLVDLEVKPTHLDESGKEW